MADDIRQRFLKNSEQGRVEVLVPDRLAKTGFDATAYSGSLFKLAGLPLYRRRKPRGIQHARSQLGRNPADRLDGLVDVTRHPAGLLVEQFEVFGQPICHPHQLQFQGGQGLAQFVVNFAGNPRALFLADELQVGGESVPLLIRFAIGVPARMPRRSGRMMCRRRNHIFSQSSWSSMYRRRRSRRNDLNPAAHRDENTSTERLLVTDGARASVDGD